MRISPRALLLTTFNLGIVADNGSIYMWDWLTGYNFQRIQSAAQPGSIDSEMGIFAMTFDQSGSRLLTCEADKSIKIYKEDDNAVSYLVLFIWNVFSFKLEVNCGFKLLRRKKLIQSTGNRIF